MGQDLSPIAHQEREQLIFYRCHMDFLIVNKDHTLHKINAQVIAFKTFPQLVSAAVLFTFTDSHADTRQKLSHMKGLHHIIIRSQIKGLYFFRFLLSGGNHYNRLIRIAADMLDHFHSVHIRKAQIQDHHIRVIGIA